MTRERERESQLAGYNERALKPESNDKKREEKKKKHERGREGGRQGERFTCILAVHRVFEGCARLTRLMHESSRARARARLFLSRHPLSCVPLPFSLSPSYSLSLPSWRFPPDILVPPRPAAARSGCLPRVSLLPLQPASPPPARLCVSPVRRLRHHQRPAITFLKTLKRSGPFCREIEARLTRVSTDSAFFLLVFPASSGFIASTLSNSLPAG